MLSTEERKIQERFFHDRLRYNAFGQRWSFELEELINKDPLWANMKYYSIERKSRNFVLKWLLKNCRGKNVLDYCCGNGDDGLFIAKNGAREVTGIDISTVAIDNCSKQVKDTGLYNVTFKVCDAEALDFRCNFFDIVTEYGALHHLNLDKAYSEIARVLKLDGKAICVEALSHNKIIHFYRKITPNLRTPWEVEHILRRKHIELAKKYFNKVEIIGFFHLFTLLAVPFRNTRAFSSILGFLEFIDNLILRLPFIKWYAWQIVFVLSEPIKEK